MLLSAKSAALSISKTVHIIGVVVVMLLEVYLYGVQQQVHLNGGNILFFYPFLLFMLGALFDARSVAAALAAVGSSFLGLVAFTLLFMTSQGLSVLGAMFGVVFIPGLCVLIAVAFTRRKQ